MSVPATISLPKLRLSSKKMIGPQIYDFLRKHITETNIKPGSLLSENLLSEHFNVSRQPVREALMRLSHEGLLSVQPQRGSIVERISVSELEQTVFVRLAIEKECIMVFPKLDVRSQRQCLSQLERNLEQQYALLNKQDDDEFKCKFLKLDDAFHERLCGISGAPMAWSTIQSIKGQMDRIRFLTFQTSVDLAEIVKEHEEVFSKLQENKIPECTDLLTYHLTQIIHTHKPILKKYSDWFTPESLSPRTKSNRSLLSNLDLT